ncbi:hypothetical protein [Sulfuriferula sp.]|uniref:hypothetical protein n=1 Tax=Sulfuriferula sp. TaxID=2025307 RepID=UPI00273027A8|nr:hypothetical protein [Sulfuriferula sp.]MDP2027497.1 hypothetical protein [Sulfuriferula sp.]
MSDLQADARFPCCGGMPYFMAVHGIPYASCWSALELEHLSGMLDEVLACGGDLATIRRIFVDSPTFVIARQRYATWLVSVFRGRFPPHRL